TPREWARLQGFPDTYKIPVSDTQAYRQFGNSVSVPVIQEIAKIIIEKLDMQNAVQKETTVHANERYELFATVGL
ncbi:MAG: DNA cytosine methyltransferase, partial [Thiovulaceae bacterium]|nr:DNA cytosine methyltransferase [Sulfurimonadaceae bacterium]